MKNKLISFLKRIICIAFCSLLLSTTTNAYSVLPIDYWYSDITNIGHWVSTPSISKIKLNNNALFYFDDGFAAAISQWNSAGISTIDNGSSTSSDIVCKGGTRSELLNNVDWLSYSDLDGRTGITFWYDSFEVYLDYNSTQKYLYQLSSSYIFIVDRGSTVNQQKNTFIHELGHALGWYGHSALNSDIMYSQITSITTLTNRDKNHLVQVY